MSTIIKKGTYRFNDVLSRITNNPGDGSSGIDFPFYVHGSSINEAPYYDASKIKIYNHLHINGNKDVTYDSFKVYTSETAKWNGMYTAIYDFYGVAPEEAIGFGQTITIVEDIEVPSNRENVATWFFENTEQVEESEAVSAIIYNGKIIGAIAKGQTATLPCNGKRMTDNIVVTLAEHNADSPLPIEVATEAEMTALLETAEVGSIYKYTGTTGTYENGALYIVEESE